MKNMEEWLVFLPDDHKFSATGGGLERSLIENSWWVVHPEKGLAFAKEVGGQSRRWCSPQCNVSEQVARKIQEKAYPNLTVRFEPIVYVRRNLDGSYPIPTEAVA